MAKDRLSGKLSVILRADVAGSTRLVQQDEQLAHERIPHNRHILSWCLLICLTCGFYTTTLFASPDYWPTNGWRSSTPEEQGMDSEKLIEMMELVPDEDYAIDNITIVRNGYLVTDAYLFPFQKHTKHLMYSITKSFTSALVGIALDKGYIKSVNQPVLDFFPEKTIANLDEQKRAITLEHLLTMASGLDTKDSWLYGWEGLGKMRASEDWVQYVLDLPMAQAPGRGFDYSNGGSHLLSAIIQKNTKMTTLEFAQKHLFAPLGISDVKWPTSRQGINTGYSEMMLTPHDTAKLGLLYLNKGRWENKQIVSEAWVEASTRKHISANVFDGYGYQWWVHSSHSRALRYYMAVGHLGQFIFVVPEKNIVVVFTSNNLEKSDFYIPKRLLEQYIIRAAVSSQPLAAQPKKKEHLDSLLANFAAPSGISFDSAMGEWNEQYQEMNGAWNLSKVTIIDETKGTYTNPNGRIQFYAIDEQGRWKGYWIEESGSTSCSEEKSGSNYWGEYIFQFNDTYSRYEGTWDMCGEGLKYPTKGVRYTVDARADEGPLGKWYDAPRDLAIWFVCERPDDERCHDEGWSSFGKSCYAISDTLESYDEAAGACEAKGAQLVSIQSSEENAHVQGLCDRRACWIGLAEPPESENWFWPDGAAGKEGEWIGYTNWNAGQPNNWNGIDEDAAFMNFWEHLDMPEPWSVD